MPDWRRIQEINRQIVQLRRDLDSIGSNGYSPDHKRSIERSIRDLERERAETEKR